MWIEQSDKSNYIGSSIKTGIRVDGIEIFLMKQFYLFLNSSNSYAQDTIFQ